MIVIMTFNDEFLNGLGFNSAGAIINMNEQSILNLENLSTLFYTSQNDQERSNSGQLLANILEDSNNFKSLISILRTSQNPHLIFLTIRTLTKNLLSE